MSDCDGRDSDNVPEQDIFYDCDSDDDESLGHPHFGRVEDLGSDSRLRTATAVYSAPRPRSPAASVAGEAFLSRPVGVTAYDGDPLPAGAPLGATSPVTGPLRHDTGVGFSQMGGYHPAQVGAGFSRAPPAGDISMLLAAMTAGFGDMKTNFDNMKANISGVCSRMDAMQSQYQQVSTELGNLKESSVRASSDIARLQEESAHTSTDVASLKDQLRQDMGFLAHKVQGLELSQKKVVAQAVTEILGSSGSPPQTNLKTPVDPAAAKAMAGPGQDGQASVGITPVTYRSSYRTPILEFDGTGFPEFLLAFECNIAVKAMMDAEKVSALIGSIAPKVRSCLKLIPNLQKCTYTEVVQRLRDLFDESTNKPLMRSRFHAIRREQKEDLLAFRRRLEYAFQNAYATVDMEERNERLAQQVRDAHPSQIQTLLEIEGCYKKLLELVQRLEVHHGIDYVTVEGALSRKASGFSPQAQVGLLEPPVKQTGLDIQQVQNLIKSTLVDCGVLEATEPQACSDSYGGREREAFIGNNGQNCGWSGYSHQPGPSERGGQRQLQPSRRPDDQNDYNPGAPQGGDQEVFTQLIDLLRTRVTHLVAPVGYQFSDWGEPYTEEQEEHILHAGELVGQIVGRSYSTPRSGCWYCGAAGHIFFRCGRLFEDIRQGRDNCPKGLSSWPTPGTASVHAVAGYQPIPSVDVSPPATFVDAQGHVWRMTPINQMPNGPAQPGVALLSHQVPPVSSCSQQGQLPVSQATERPTEPDNTVALERQRLEREVLRLDREIQLFKSAHSSGSPSTEPVNEQEPIPPPLTDAVIAGKASPEVAVQCETVNKEHGGRHETKKGGVHRTTPVPKSEKGGVLKTTSSPAALIDGYPDWQTIPDKGSQGGSSLELPMSPEQVQRSIPPGASPRQMLPGRRPFLGHPMPSRASHFDQGYDSGPTEAQSRNIKSTYKNFYKKKYVPSRQLERQLKHSTLGPSAAVPPIRVSSSITRGTGPPRDAAAITR